MKNDKIMRYHSNNTREAINTVDNSAITISLKKAVYLDVECYPNYFAICFLCNNKRKYYETRGDDRFSKEQIEELKIILSEYVTIGFNSNEYDIPMIRIALMGKSTKALKHASDVLINKAKGQFSWKILKEANVPQCQMKQHIDIYNVLPGVSVPLKTYAARIGFKKLQDLPYEPDKILTQEQMDEVRDYCFNDIEITEALTYKMEKELEIRYLFSNEYNVDLMSKSDASIAEKIFNTKYGIPYKEDGYVYNQRYLKYESPEYLQFSNPVLIDLFKQIKLNNYELSDDAEIINIPYKIKLGDTNYKVGIGGIHSQEKRIHFDSCNKILVEIDVVSYYPNIMINNRYIPTNHPKNFIQDYEWFYNERLEAKSIGNKTKNETCKIILNGTFGKLGSNKSSLYSPNLLLNVTLTGQLSLLMLIEQLEANGISVVSANTDGILINTSDINEFALNKIVRNWEERCNFKTTCTRFRDVYKRSVNDYIGITKEGDIKTKGFMQYSSLRSNSIEKICRSAVINYLQKNIMIEDTIYSMGDDIRNFLIFKKSTDGAYYQGQRLGKTVRWYYSTQGDVILKGNGNKVQESTGAIPLMEIPENLKCDDIDFDRYIARANKVLQDIGVS